MSKLYRYTVAESCRDKTLLQQEESNGMLQLVRSDVMMLLLLQIALQHTAAHTS